MSFNYEWDEIALEQFLQILTEIKKAGGYKKKAKVASEVTKAIGLITVFPQSGVDFSGYDEY